MKTASVGDLRNNYSMVESWLSDGESVRIERRGKPVALLRPLPNGSEGKKRRIARRVGAERRGGGASGV